MHSIFDKTRNFSPSHKSARKSPGQTYLPENEDTGWEWYNPPENSPPVKFFMDTSLHGLQYLGQRKRHLCERLFWLTAFTVAVVTAAMLIWQMWSTYQSLPIITVFRANEKTLNEIPFPAVTICNNNNIQKSKMQEIKRKAQQGQAGNLPQGELLRALASLMDIFHICEAAKAFTSRFTTPALTEGFGEVENLMRERSIEYEHLMNTKETLRTLSQPCKEMILLCVWLNKVRNCSDLFQGIETDYGYCCTFNTIPVSLLLKDIEDQRDDPQRVQDWKDADVHYDNLIFNSETKDRKYPLRQRYPGRSAGLSIILNPDLKEYYCTNTDSDGYVAALNVPLDFPRMRDNGIAVRTNSEVFISVRPDITMADESILQFSLESRKCYLHNERSLPHYTQYTTSNCMAECIANKTLKKCHCIRYYMPNSPIQNEKLCAPAMYNCTEDVKEEIVRIGIGNTCRRCLPTCTEIDYHSEVTSLPMRQGHMKHLFKTYPQYSNVSDASIVHVYFNVDATYPRLRKETTTVINLISNAGGLLGLCMGFSILSLLEIIYHATIRLLCNFYWKQSKLQKNGRRKSSRNNNLDDNDANTINFTNDMSNGKKNGFLSKIFQVGSSERRQIHDSHTNPVDQFNLSSVEHTVPAYFNTPFGSDFQRVYLSSAKEK